MNALMSYQFEEALVRVVMVADDPWFVANDLARVLGYSATAVMTRLLDEDEKGTHVVRTLGGEQEHTIISESGMYAVVLKSRRAEAKRFRRWVTGEVLPSLRKTGKYQLHDHEPPPLVASDYDPPRLVASVGVVREARRLFGVQAARNCWVQLGLPACVADAEISDDGDPMASPLKDWLDGKDRVTSREAAAGIGLSQPFDFQTLQRIGRLIGLMGWIRTTERRADGTVKVWLRPAASQEMEG